MPWTHFSPASSTSHLEESIMIGTRDTSGSDASIFRKLVISSAPSSNPSSMLMSSTCAPSSTCFRAMSSASSYFFCWISRKNRREPATLHRSPIFKKLICGDTTSLSNPESCMYSGAAGLRCGTAFSTIRVYSAICSGVVPQQPPTILTSSSSMNSLICPAIFSGVSSYSPSWLGSPALGYTLM